MKKNTKVTFSRSFSILAAAALSMTLIGGQSFPVYAGNSSGIEAGAVIPDNITIDSPTALANIALPSNAYGTLSWVDGSYVPDKRVQSCAVVFKPAAGEDLSGLPGWDSSSGTLTGSVTVVVSSFDSTEGETGNEKSTDSSDSGESYENYDKEETTSDNNENSADDSVKETEESTAESTGQEENSQDDSKQDNEEENSENTENPEQSSSDTTDASGEEIRDPEVTEAPEVTEIPEVTSAPAENDKTQDSEETKAEETPAAEDSVDTDASSENGDDEIAEKEVDAEVTEIPEVTESPEDSDNTDNIFDRTDDTEDKRPQNAATDLTETEKEATAAQNHTCDGITVSGIDLPWYVQFRVSGGDDYQFTNEEDATIFKSYEFELWDTQNNTEYKIPDGEYISVTVPVKAGYTYSIEHLLDNGAMETIIPSVDGDTMTFSTHSFSPFGIAGSKSLVGPDAESDTSTTVTPAADTSATDSSSTGTTSANTTDSAQTDSTDTSEPDTSSGLISDSTDQEDTSSQNDNTAEDEAEDQSSGTVSKKQVNTGDSTQILPFVILFVAAAVVAGVAVFFKKRKK